MSGFLLFLLSKKNAKDICVNKHIEGLYYNVNDDMHDEFYECLDILEKLCQEYEILNKVIECVVGIIDEKSIKIENPKSSYHETFDKKVTNVTRNGFASVRIKIYDMKKKTTLNISEYGIRVIFDNEGFSYTCSADAKSIIDLEGPGTMLSLKHDKQEIENLVPTLRRWHNIK